MWEASMGHGCRIELKGICIPTTGINLYVLQVLVNFGKISKLVKVGPFDERVGYFEAKQHSVGPI